MPRSRSRDLKKGFDNNTVIMLPSMQCTEQMTRKLFTTLAGSVASRKTSCEHVI